MELLYQLSYIGKIRDLIMPRLARVASKQMMDSISIETISYY